MDHIAALPKDLQSDIMVKHFHVRCDAATELADAELAAEIMALAPHVPKRDLRVGYGRLCALTAGLQDASLRAQTGVKLLNRAHPVLWKATFHAVCNMTGTLAGSEERETIACELGRKSQAYFSRMARREPRSRVRSPNICLTTPPLRP